MRKKFNAQKKHYDKNIKYSKFEPGDLVLVKQKAFKGKHKIQDKIEPIVF